MKESPELRAIRLHSQVTQHNQEALGLAWLFNPEQEKLRRELPFIADALDSCLKYVRQESVDKIERKLRKDSQPFTTKQKRTQEAWAKEKQRRRKLARPTPPHEPRTGRFLPKEK